MLLRTGSPSALQGRPEKQQGDEEIKIILHHKCCSVFVLLPKNYLPLLHTITQTCSNTANPPCFDIAIKQNCSKARQKWRCGFQIPYFQAPARHLHKSSSTKCSARQGDCLNSNLYVFSFVNASCAIIWCKLFHDYSALLNVFLLKRPTLICSCSLLLINETRIIIYSKSNHLL